MKRIRRYEVDDCMGKTYRKEEFSFNRDDFNSLVLEFEIILSHHLDEIYEHMKKNYVSNPDTKDIIDESYLEQKREFEEDTEFGVMTVSYPMYYRLFDGLIDFLGDYLRNKMTDDDIIRLITRDGTAYGGEVI